MKNYFFNFSISIIIFFTDTHWLAVLLTNGFIEEVWMLDMTFFDMDASAFKRLYNHLIPLNEEI